MTRNPGDTPVDTDDNQTPGATGPERTPGGDPVHRHEDPQYDGPAPRDERRRAALDFHLRRFLGDDFTVLSEKVSFGIHLDLYAFAATEERPWVTLVTAGMSDRAMELPGGSDGGHLELMLAVPAGWPGIDPLDSGPLADPTNYWPIKLLKDVARIPSTYHAHLAWGHTIVDNDGDIFAGAPFRGALIGPPLGFPPELMRATTPEGEVDVLAIFPLLPDELDYKVKTPGGGDALVDRLHERGVTAVIDPARPPVVSGPPSWSAHVLTDIELSDLGDALAGVMPNRSMLLAEDGSTEEVLPAGDAGDLVRWRVSGPITPDALHRDAAATGSAELMTAAKEHRGVITLTPERHDPEHPTVAVLAMVSMLVDRGLIDGGRVTALWLPEQRHVSTPAQFQADVEANVPLTCRVHPVDLPGHAPAVQSHGLAALGGQEVLYRGADLTTDQLLDRARRMLTRHFETSTDLPAAGTIVKYGGTRYEMMPATHPTTGEQVLEIQRAAGRKFRLFGRGR